MSDEQNQSFETTHANLVSAPPEASELKTLLPVKPEPARPVSEIVAPENKTESDLLMREHHKMRAWLAYLADKYHGHEYNDFSKAYDQNTKA